MRFSLALAAVLLLVGAGCNDAANLNSESSETKPEIQEKETMVTPDLNTDDQAKSDELKKPEAEKMEVEDNDEQEDDGDDDKKVDTTSAVKPTETKPAETTTPVTTGSKTYTMAEVQAQAAAGKCWTVINSGVYDLSAWINKHPGGAAAIKSLCGINGTAKFQAMHGGDPKPEKVLTNYYLGALK